MRKRKKEEKKEKENKKEKEKEKEEKNKEKEKERKEEKEKEKEKMCTAPLLLEIFYWYTKPIILLNFCIKISVFELFPKSHLNF